MKIDLQQDEADYRALQEIKKVNPDFVNGGILFNQQVLTACGAIDATFIERFTAAERDKFISDNKDFFESFAWVYYQDWRKTRAKSVAAAMDIYRMLNVNIPLQAFVGETFYAGIPLITQQEVNTAIAKHAVFESDDGVGLKVGVDGQLHKTDKYGDFPDILDTNDIYGDGTNVSKKELDKLTLLDNTKVPKLLEAMLNEII